MVIAGHHPEARACLLLVTWASHPPPQCKGERKRLLAAAKTGDAKELAAAVLCAGMGPTAAAVCKLSRLQRGAFCCTTRQAGGSKAVYWHHHNMRLRLSRHLEMMLQLEGQGKEMSMGAR